MRTPSAAPCAPLPRPAPRHQSAYSRRRIAIRRTERPTNASSRWFVAPLNQLFLDVRYSAAALLRARPAANPAPTQGALRERGDCPSAQRLEDTPWLAVRTTRLVMTSSTQDVAVRQHANPTASAGVADVTGHSATILSFFG